MYDVFAYYRSKEAAETHRAGVLIEGTAAGKPTIRTDLLRVCLAWEASGAQWMLPDTPMPDTEQAAWLWLWEGCSVHLDDEETSQEYLDACGMVYEDARLLWRIAMQNRLLYPDGTIAGCLQDLARRTITGIGLTL